METVKEKIAFCHKRISEQNEYIATTTSRTDITEERRAELLESATGVKARFEKGLKALETHPGGAVTANRCA